MEIEGRKITDIGMFQTGKATKNSGLLILVTVAFATILFFLDTGYTVLLSFILLVIVSLSIALTNILVGVRSTSRDLKEGEVQEVIVLRYNEKTDYIKYVAFLSSDNESPGEDTSPNEQERA